MRTSHIIRRAQLLWALRSFFQREGYLELEAPCIVTSPGLEPQLDAMVVNARYAHADQPARRWLHTSPEYALKRFLGQSALDAMSDERLETPQRVYAIGACFRDELPSSTHSPEFTMLEWYARDLTLEGLMAQCESLIRALAALTPEATQRLGLHERFERLSVCEAFLKYAEIDLTRCEHIDDLQAAARAAGIRESALEGSWDELYFQIFMDLIEPHLGVQRPTFLYDFPASQAALARLSPDDPRWARRFELFIGGVELANAFDELIDPVEQRARFQEVLTY